MRAMPETPARFSDAPQMLDDLYDSGKFAGSQTISHFCYDKYGAKHVRILRALEVRAAGYSAGLQIILRLKHIHALLAQNMYPWTCLPVPAARTDGADNPISHGSVPLDWTSKSLNDLAVLFRTYTYSRKCGAGQAQVNTKSDMKESHGVTVGMRSD